MDYQIEDDFLTDPTHKGWSQFIGTDFKWDSIDIITGDIGHESDTRYSKFLGKIQRPTDNIIGTFTLVMDNIVGLSPLPVLIGFFDSNQTAGQEECFAIKIHSSGGLFIPQIYVAYDDGTKLETTSTYNLTSGTKYKMSLIYSPEDGKAHLQIYDFLTETLLSEISIDTDATKDFALNQVGISNMTATVPTDEAVIKLYEVDALGDPSPIVYSDLYATPDEARSMVNLDPVQDMTDNTIAMIETTFAIPQVNSRFRSEGYSAPFKTGDDTPPLVKTITALLTAAYAARKSYIAVDPSDSPVYKDLLKEVNNLWDSLLNGELELLDKDGNWIERSLETSSRMLSTTEGEYNLFTLDDVPDIDSVMSGRLYIGRPGT